MKRQRVLTIVLFPRIYVINLPHRADRRAEMNRELRNIGLSLDHPQVELFEASYPANQGEFPSRGARGCFESHLRVHRAIRDAGFPRALVLEDDAQFAPQFLSNLQASKPVLAGDWDIFYSVAHLVAERDDQDLGHGMIRLSPAHKFFCAHFVGFSAKFSHHAVDYLTAMAARKDGDPEGGPMHVDGAYVWMRRDNPDLRAIAARIPLAQQRSSRSDITQGKFYDRLPVLRDIANMGRPLLA